MPVEIINWNARNLIFVAENKRTFDFGSDDVDVFIVGGGGSEESHPIAVAHSVSVDLCDLVVAAESVSYLQQRSTTNIIAMMYIQTQTSSSNMRGVDRNPNAKTHLSNKSIKPSGKLKALWPNTHLMPKNNGEMTKHTHTKNQQMRCFAQIKIISIVSCER
jgi:hypothetical protein